MLPRLSGPRRSLSAMGCTQRSGPSTVEELDTEAAKVLNEHEPAKDLSYLMKKQAYARMLDYLLAGGERCYLTEVPCVVHGKPCVAHPGHQADFDDESEQCWNFAGTTCTGWSAAGKGNFDIVFQFTTDYIIIVCLRVCSI